MSFFAEFLALSVGLIWAVSGLISVGPVRVYGGLAFNRIRMNVVILGLVPLLLLSGGLQWLSWFQVMILGISGFIGIFLGDTLLFLALGRLGPRRNALIFSSNAPMAALMATAIGKDSLAPHHWLGMAILGCGICLAIVFGKRRDQLHHWEEVRGPLAVGVLISLAAALCQALGLVISDIVIDVDPADKPPVLLVALIRVGIAAVGLNVIFALMREAMPAMPGTPTRRHFAMACLSGIWGMGLGMTVLVWSQSLSVNVALVSALSQTSPVWILPLIWILTRQRPANLAFVGAGLAMVGVALISF